jgi:surface antigen
MNNQHVRFIQSIRALGLAGLVTLVTAVTPARAHYEHFLGSSIIGNLGKTQSATFVRTFMATLNDTPDGDSVALAIPAEGKSHAIGGTLTILRTKQVGNKPCRKIESKLEQGTKKDHWTGWYCKEKNGAWKGQAVAD